MQASDEPTVHYPLAEVETANGAVKFVLIVKPLSGTTYVALRSEDSDSVAVPLLTLEQWADFVNSVAISQEQIESALAERPHAPLFSDN